MAKAGRNDPCPCGSGKKYKKCCLMKDEAETQAQLDIAPEARLRHDVRTQAEHDERDSDRRLQLRRMREAIAARLSMADDGDFDDDLLMDASNAVVDLIHAGKLDEAEAGARELLAQYPDVHDGWDRLGMVHEARGEHSQAADCYRKVVEFLQRNPDYAEAGLKDMFAERIAQLDPPTAS